MKSRENPCMYYVNCGADCLKGRKNVQHKVQCQHCKKYQPRKAANQKFESRETRIRKICNRDFREQQREY